MEKSGSEESSSKLTEILEGDIGFGGITIDPDFEYQVVNGIPSPPNQDQAQNGDKIGGGNLKGEDIISTGQPASPPETATIYA